MKMSRFLKQALAVVLAVQTCLTGLPSAVFAEENFPEETTIPTEETEAETGETVSAPETAEVEQPEEAELTEETETDFEEPEQPAESEEPELPEAAEETEVIEETELKPVLLYPADALVIDGEDLVLSITAGDGFSLPLTVLVNEQTFEAGPGEDGRYVFRMPLSELGAGTYPVAVTFAGNEEFDAAELLLEFTVEEQTGETDGIEVNGYTVTLFRAAEVQEPSEEPEETEERAEYADPYISVGCQLDTVPDVYDSKMYFTSVQYDSSLDDGTYQVQYKLEESLLNAYLVAVRDGKTWFIDHYENPGSGTKTRAVRFELPAGEYELRIGLFTSGYFKASSDYYRLVVFDEPKVVGTGSFKGTEYGYIDIDVASLLSKDYFTSPGVDYSTVWLYASKENPEWTSRVLSAVSYYSSDGIYRLRLGDPNAYDGTGTYKDVPYGSFDLSWKLRGSGTVKGKYIFSNSSSVHVDILQDIKPTELHANIVTGSDYPYLFYKGQTAQIRYWFGDEYDNESDPDQRVDDLNRSVIFTSSNKKEITVDANGKVTVVSVPKPGEAPFEPTILITSAADPAVTCTVSVKIFPVESGKADMKVLFDGKEYSTFQYTLGKQRSSGHLVDVVFRIAEPYSDLLGMPVTFSSDSKNIGFLSDPDNTSSPFYYVYSGIIGTDGTVRAVVRGWEPGSHKVSVTTPFGKSAAVTINIDGNTNNLAGGSTKSSEYYINGKTVTGWIRYDSVTDTYTMGKNVFKTAINPSHEYISYIDPATKKIVTGDPLNGLPDTVKNIDGKLYAFNAGDGLILHQGSDGYADEGWITIEHEQFDAYNAYVSKTGVLQTGWVNTKEDGLLYFDKDLGYIITSSFVPAQNGKGMTYVDSYGSIVSGILVPSKETKKITEQDGLYRIPEAGGAYYWVKDGAFYTGWLYLHYSDKTGFVWNTTARGALEKMYFDPNDHGALSTGYFRVDGKDYYADMSKYPDFCSEDGYDYYVSVQTLAGLYTNYPEKYGCNTLNGTIIDANGAIVYNKLVKIAVWNTDKYLTYYTYAGNDGKPVTDTWQAVDGKMYYFDSNGWLEMADLYPTAFYFYDESSAKSTVYYKLKNTKNPLEGYLYYDLNGNKLTSLMLYDSSLNPVSMLDDKGNLVVDGIAKVRYSLSDTAKHMLIADSSGNIIMSPTESYYRCVDVKGKTYAVDKYGEVVTADSEPIYARDTANNRYGYVMPGKNGVLNKKKFMTVNDSSAGQYKIWLDENGFAVNYCTVVYEQGMKYHAYYVNGKSWLTFDTGKGYYGFVIPGKTIISDLGTAYTAGWQGSQDDSPLYLNKDGSLKTGFVKHGANTKYLASAAYGLVTSITSDPINMDGTNRTLLFKINGKTYFFDHNGNMVTGWVHFDQALTIDILDYVYENPYGITNYENIYMYFSPKDGHAVTGKNKVPVPQLFDGKISLADEGDSFVNGEKRVNTTSVSQTLYFTSEGMLIHDTEALISKKLMKFGADGTTDSDAHWEDAAKSRYILKSGALASGRTKIDGNYYYFDSQTGYKVVNQLRKTGSKWYYYNEYGKQATPVMGTYKMVRLPEYMENEWGSYANIYLNSTNNKKLTALWNKDGSLAKIVYTDTNNPASGESISFGLWNISDSLICQEYIAGGLNGYVLDSKGLPQTGIVTGFSFFTDTGFDTYTLNVEKDGRKVYGSTEGSLVRIGKKYYVMREGLICENAGSVIEITDWSSLPAADQKTLDELAKHAEGINTGMYVMLNNDGSAAVNTNRYLTVNFGHNTVYGSTLSGNMRSNRLGVILDLCNVFYRVGKNTYLNTAAVESDGTYEIDISIEKISNYDIQEISATFKFNGNRLLGIYDSSTGKALNGVYVVSLFETGETIWLKNGQPQSGNQTVDYYGRKWKFYVDPDMIGTSWLFHY